MTNMGPIAATVAWDTTGWIVIIVIDFLVFRSNQNLEREFCLSDF